MSAPLGCRGKSAARGRQQCVLEAPATAPCSPLPPAAVAAAPAEQSPLAAERQQKDFSLGKESIQAINAASPPQ